MLPILIVSPAAGAAVLAIETLVVAELPIEMVLAVVVPILIAPVVPVPLVPP